MEGKKLDRRGFVALTGAASLGALLAACGGGNAPSEPAATTAAAAGATTETAGGETAAATAAAAAAFDAASEPDGKIEVFEWAGYEAPEMWADYINGPYGKASPLKFTFLENDQQALAKVASGYNPDIIHPCIAYTKDWAAAELIQPWDTSLLPDFSGIPTSISGGGVIDGKQYHVPFDIGFSTLTYRADKIPLSPDDESWNVLLNTDYAGKMATFSDDVTIIKIGALINEGAIDPNVLTSEQIQAAKETMIKVKPNLRNFWDSQTDTVNDFVNGNLWATYTWPDGYWKIKNHPKMKDVEIRYMSPKEGRLAWVCGFVLNTQTERPGRAHAAVAAANEPKTAAWLTDAFQYGAAQQDGVTELIKDKALIKAFSLDDPSAFAPPRAWFEKPLDNRKEYVDASAEVKAS
jgi:spermidine/putrescine transport system substrate-binding protein